MGVLADIETTLKNSDISLIKNKLFTNLCKLGRSHSADDCVTFPLYELIKLDLSIDDVELLILNGVCIPHAIFNEIDLVDDTPIKFVSDFDACKLYVGDSAEFYKQYGIDIDKISDWERSLLTCDYIERKLLSCLIVFDIQTQQEYCTFRDTHLEKQWKTDSWQRGYIGASGLAYNFPSFNPCN